MNFAIARRLKVYEKDERSGGFVSKDDFHLPDYLGETIQEIEHLREKVPQLLGDA